MSNRSKISRLPKAIRFEINKLLADGATIDEITDHIQALGHNIGRSSVGRYSQQAKSDVIAKINQSLELSTAMGEGLSLDAQNKQHQNILALLNTLMTTYAFEAVHGDEKLAPKDLAMLGRAVKDAILSSQKLEDIKKIAKAEALADMEKAAKKDGNKKPLEIVAELKKGYGFE